MELFKMKEFTKETSLKVGDSWDAGLCTEDPRKGYHAHFGGNSSKEAVQIRIAYYSGAIGRHPSHPPPSTERIMEFIGSFIRERQYRALVYATFDNKDTEWKSRFNLPFKVTMADKKS
jgi:hypothetical protein